MTTNFPALLQGGTASLPAALQQVMHGMQQSEMQENVGQSFAVVSIKGKVFSIKFGGNNTPLTLSHGGQTFAAPYFDVVIPKANPNLSKTYYKSGYTEGSDEQPDCWSEDGHTPLGPMEKRPVDPRTGAGCTSCDLCPMNQFGSKVSDNGSKGKACADTRKVIVYPMAPTGQVNPDGSPVTVLDSENAAFGGAMLLRVPAASLKVFAEYDRKLNEIGLSYFTVVTRMAFDTTQAYPKFTLQPLRVVTDAEANQIVALRDSAQVKQILATAQTGAAPVAALPSPDMAHLAGQPAPAVLAQQQIPTPQVVPVATPAPVVAAPAAAAPSPIPTPPPLAPVAAPAPVVAFPPEGWQAHPQAPGYFYCGQEVLTEADLRARVAQPAPPAAMAPPPAPAPVQSAAVAATPAPAATVQVSPHTFDAVDSLLAG